MQELKAPKPGYKYERFLFGQFEEIPHNWQIVKFIDLCKGKPMYGAAISAQRRNNILPRYIRITDLNDNGTLREKESASIMEEDARPYILSEGDILFARTGATVGKTYLYKKEDGKCAFAGYLIKFIPDQKMLDAEFIFHYTHSYNYWRWLKSMQTEGVQPNVNAKQYSNMLILKSPLSEQQKISLILSTVDKLIQKTDQIIEQTQRLKKGLMQKLMTKGIGHSTYQKLTLFPSYLSTMIPEDWSIVKFGEVTKRITYGFTNPMPHAEEGPWLITAKDIKHGRINYGTAEKTTSQAYKQLLSDKSRPALGTVLITKDGTLGEVGIVDREDTCINQSVASLEPTEAISSEFLALCLQSPITKRIIEAHSPSTTIKHISITDLAEWKFGLPPLEEQERVISVLSSVDGYIANYNQSKSKLQNIKQGLMQNLLSGKIRVKV